MPVATMVALVTETASSMKSAHVTISGVSVWPMRTRQEIAPSACALTSSLGWTLLIRMVFSIAMPSVLARVFVTVQVVSASASKAMKAKLALAPAALTIAVAMEPVSTSVIWAMAKPGTTSPLP